jgi:hypothetical protein
MTWVVLSKKEKEFLTFIDPWRGTTGILRKTNFREIL